MYTKIGAASVAGGTATLPVTGFSIGWTVVLGVSALLFGAVLLRLVPRLRRTSK